MIDENREMKDMVSFVDTHCHLDGEEFDQDRAEVMQRAREAGCKAIFLPAIDLPSSQRILALSQQYPDFLYPMNKQFKDRCKDKIDLTWFEEPGIHEWGFWDRNIQRVLDWLPLDKKEAD